MSESVITKNQLVIDKIVLRVHLRLAMWIQTVGEEVLTEVFGLGLLDERRQDGGDGRHVEEDEVRLPVADVDGVILVDNRIRVQRDLVFCVRSREKFNCEVVMYNIDIG